ncbi:MAG TPA: hypothetical protein VGO62_18705 [Myxococcota bacterium]
MRSHDGIEALENIVSEFAARPVHRIECRQSALQALGMSGRHVTLEIVFDDVIAKFAGDLRAEMRDGGTREHIARIDKEGDRIWTMSASGSSYNAPTMRGALRRYEMMTHCCSVCLHWFLQPDPDEWWRNDSVTVAYSEDRTRICGRIAPHGKEIDPIPENAAGDGCDVELTAGLPSRIFQVVRGVDFACCEVSYT